MKENSRTLNTIYNFISSIGGQLITIVLHFVVRTVFINTLGKSYLGINSLFADILSMLSLAEFGVGTAILYKLYDPIAKEDHQRITQLMKLYKSIYRVIGVIVFVIGVCLVPFLPLIISDYNRLADLNINAILIFSLYLLRTLSSYFFFAYKSAIVRAHQKAYLINIISYVTAIGLAVVQIIGLTAFKSFELYVLMAIVEVIVKNIICAKLSDKMYPFINDSNSEKISISEVKSIFKDCSAIFLYKLNGVVLKSTDNLVISFFLGLDKIALYSNYFVFYTTINGLFTKVYSSVSHSLGNLHTTDNTEHEYKIFETMNLITAIIGGTAAVGIFVVADELILNWIGQDWIIEQPFALLLGIETFTLALRLSIYRFRTSMGLFQQAKYRPIFGMMINLVVSVMLVNKLGISGVVIGTIVSDWATTMWYDPIIIHKYGFKNMYPVSNYFFKLVKYFFIIVIVGGADWFICRNFIVGMGWISVIIHMLICLVTVPSVLYISAFNKAEGQYLYKHVISYANKFLRKIRRK